MKRYFVVLLTVLFVVILNIIIKYDVDDFIPECYLIELDKECTFGYYRVGGCYNQFNLRECCSGGKYILKGVHGDKSCWFKSQTNEEMENYFKSQKGE